MVFSTNLNNEEYDEDDCTFINSEYHGVIKYFNLEGRDGQTIIFNSDTLISSYNQCLYGYIEIGDSLLKLKGKKFIIVFKKQIDGSYKAKRLVPCPHNKKKGSCNC